jgi:hypothetical protein
MHVIQQIMRYGPSLTIQSPLDGISSLKDTMKDEDAINLHVVDLVDIQELTRAKECLTTVMEMITFDVQHLTEGSPDFKRFAHDLDALIIFCTEDDDDLPADEYDGQPLVYHQNILTDLYGDRICLVCIGFSSCIVLFRGCALLDYTYVGLKPPSV